MGNIVKNFKNNNFCKNNINNINFNNELKSDPNLYILICLVIIVILVKI